MGVTIENAPAIAPENSLFAQTHDLSRARILQDVLSTPLSQALLPLFQPLTADEQATIPTIAVNSTQEGLQECISGISNQVLSRINTNMPEFEEISEFDTYWPVFFWGDIRKTVTEGVKSGIAIPSIVAAHIYMIEEGLPNAQSTFVNNFVRDEALNFLNVEKLLTIMQRDSFNAILMRLTKGPNGFLGRISTHVSHMWWRNFFDFMHPTRTDERFVFEGTRISSRSGLRFHEAYAVEAGEVTGLSGLYSVAAQARRQKIRADYLAVEGQFDQRHDPVDSSGCPMRHHYKDQAGNEQEPLIFTAKQFLVQPLRAAIAAHA